MAYITQQGLIERGWERQLVQLTDKTNKPATTIDDTIVARHIVDAESMIDSYLAKRYVLPLAQVPPVLEKVAADLAIYFIHGSSIDKDSAVATAYRGTMTWLSEVSKGTVTIEGATPTAPAQAGGGQILTAGPERQLTRDSLSGL
jgi:phage gp36-like protein